MKPQIAESKCIVVVNADLRLGLKANAVSVISMTLGQRVVGLVGPDVKDADRVLHPGIVLIPIPILIANSDVIRQIWQQAGEELVRIGFSSLAQSCRTYDEYVGLFSSLRTDELDFAGIGLFGATRSVNRLAGSLPLLR